MTTVTTSVTEDDAAQQERPLVSLLVLGYNQENYLRQTIEGAFAQTYSPLEIVLSDDCSSDATFAIMEEMAASYEGPHRVVLHRNSENLGSVGNVNRLMELSRGAFVVQTDGDDISLPDRTARLVEVWRASGGKVKVVHSATRRISPTGELSEVGEKLRSRPPLTNQSPYEIIERGSFNIVGATMGWSRDLWDVFGPLWRESTARTSPDWPIAFRARLIGEIAWIDEPLLLYRTGGVSDSTSYKSKAEYRRKRVKYFYSFSENYLRDMKIVPPPDYERCRRLAERNRDRTLFEMEVAETSFSGRVLRGPQAVWRAARQRDLSPLRVVGKYLLPAWVGGLGG